MESLLRLAKCARRDERRLVEEMRKKKKDEMACVCVCCKCKRIIKA